MRRHLDRMIEVFGEEQGCRKFRKVAIQYSRAFGPTKEFDKRVVLLRARAEFDDIVAGYRRWRAQFEDARGELLPGYEPRVFASAVVAVPAGPNEQW